MPEQEGLETLRHRQLTRPELPVIAISERLAVLPQRPPGVSARHRRLPKPITQNDLLRAVRQALTPSAVPPSLGGLDTRVKRCTYARKIPHFVSRSVAPRHDSEI